MRPASGHRIFHDAPMVGNREPCKGAFKTSRIQKADSFMRTCLAILGLQSGGHRAAQITKKTFTGTPPAFNWGAKGFWGPCQNHL